MARHYRCSIDECGELSLSLRGLVLHTRVNHSLCKNLMFTCPVRGCFILIRNAETFRKHVYYKHPSELDSGRALSVDVEMLNNVGAEENIYYNDGDEFQAHEEPTPITCSQVFNKVVREIEKEAALLRLQIEHKFNLPTNSSKSIYEESVQFSISLQRRLSELALMRLKELEIGDTDLQFYLQCPELETLCHTTDGSNLSALKDLGYVEPQKKDLYDLAERQAPPNIKKRPIMHYVPIIDTLKAYLSHEDVISCILRETFESEHFESFTSGSIFKNHPLFSVHKNALRIHLYTDELELCNPLGGNTKKHKICCIYFQVGNIGPKNLSSIQSIHLVCIARWPHVLKFGYKTILKPLIAELKQLDEDGIRIKVKSGGIFHFRAAVAMFVGDNASMHALGGFRRCFSSGKVCRFCLADFSELSRLSGESQCTMRSPELHDWHVQMVQRDESLTAMYGVTGPSVLSSVPHFIVPFCLPPDLMHDVLEKVLTLNVKFVLRGLVRNKVLSYRRAQAIHSAFIFSGIDGVNKHPGLPDKLFSKKVHLKGSAAQKLHLFHFFSLVFGPHVPAENKYWQLHLLLNRILDIGLSTTTSTDMALELQVVVTEHHKLWVELFPNCYPPKLHYLHHYYRSIFLNGPVRHLWSMRFEVFHQILVNVANRSRNFKNITETLSTKVQMKKCLELSGDKGLPPSIQIKSAQKGVLIQNFPKAVRDCSSKLCLDPVALVQANSVTSDGLLIKHGCYNILDVQDGDPVFLLVEAIFCNLFTVLVYGKLVPSRGFNEHLHAFEIGSDDSLESVCVEGSQLYCGQTLKSYNIDGNLYIKLKFTPLK